MADQPLKKRWPYVVSAIAGIVLVAWVVFSLYSQDQRCSDRGGELRRGNYTTECVPAVDR